ncbi:MAG: acetyl-CoA carboxylase biotin carboxylase subunit [Planctomycetes bacterium]|nr:acetyl-CoA carboxylase biotin carboxylase subunit [Planctomycetota bacterium]
MFRHLLIANRGEVAVRIARAARDLGVVPIGVHSQADARASWLEAFEESVCIGTGPPEKSYLRASALVQAALQTGCSAVHPGWGFLAENARFAALCGQHGLTFVGPRPAVMDRMGLKWPAKRAMAAAGLMGIPGSDGILADADQAARVASEVGYPVLLKADAGGGGRGMRLCEDEPTLRTAFVEARTEARAAFGNDDMYLESYVSGGRHVEVQVLADARGAAIHLGERECSIQRNHQKLIEESPSPALSPTERTDIGLAAAAASAQVGYCGAGTIEFLRLPTTGQLCFMEMNTRLQVEHPVSESVSGVDIVQAQLRLAANQPLGLTQDQVRLSGHSIECRINAEDVHRNFQPTPGTVRVFDLPTEVGPGQVRVDTHLRAGDEVPPQYDSLLAKVIVHAETRDLAIETMQRALSGARVEGVSTTLPLHLAVLSSPEFASGEYDTSSLPFDPANLEASASPGTD